MVYLGKSAMVLLLLFGLAAFVLPEQVEDDVGTRQRIYAYPTANSDASQEARDLLRTLYAIKGGYTLSGQHNYLEEPKKHTRRIHELTGELPALVGYEMGVVLDHTEAEVESYRQKIVDDAIATYKAGSFVTMTYHAAMPGQCQCWEQVNNGGISEEMFEEIITPGTALHKEWLADIDEVAVYLKQLRDHRVPVLWRPYHEMNGKWFWWGGQPKFQQLWNLMFERYSEVHKLDNLLWVWSPSAPNDYAARFESYYVGDLRTDILAVDVYYNDYKQSHHDQLWKLAGGKPIALGEVGELPDPALLKGSQNQYVWFMAWGDELENKNDYRRISSLYQMDRVLTRPDLIAYFD